MRGERYLVNMNAIIALLQGNQQVIELLNNQVGNPHSYSCAATLKPISFCEKYLQLRQKPTQSCLQLFNFRLNIALFSRTSNTLG